MKTKLVVFLFLLGVFFGGCASAPPPDASMISSGPHSKTVTLHLKNSSYDEITSELAQVKSAQVTVSTQSLKSLLLNQKTLQNQCRTLSTQLEALKSLDVEEFESRE